MTRASLRHPFRTQALTGAQVGWGRPLLAVGLALAIPFALASLFLFIGNPVFAGPPKDGIGYTWRDHIDIFMACLAASIVVSWIMAPIAVLALRAAAMLGFAGWGTAVLAALITGLPTVHFVLNGDVTTEDQTILPHIIAAIAFLGLSVWAAFWSLFRLKHRQGAKSPNFASKK